METTISLRCYRAWIVSLVFLCLPWLVVTGKGFCPLQPSPAAQPAAKSAACQHCCPATTDSTTPAPSPAQAPLRCCDAFKLFLQSEDAIPKLGVGPVALSPAWDDAFALALFPFAAPERTDGSDGAVPSEAPPGAFLQIISRRCQPGNAPPFIPAA